MTEQPAVLVRETACAGLARLSLNRPPTNILDQEMVEALEAALAGFARRPELKAFVLDAEGDHFSYGASVQEHRTDEAAGMLTRFHRLCRSILDLRLPFLAVLRGRCLGGGLELALLAHRILAAPEARLGQPEIRLGVFAPVASLLLPQRVGPARAAELLLGGHELSAREAREIGLVDEVAPDPFAAAQEHYQVRLAPHSAFSLRRAQAAANWQRDRDFRAGLEGLERLYLDDLMAGDDPQEGLAAFLEKRPPRWRNS